MYLFSWLHLPIISQTTIVSEKTIVLLSSHVKSIRDKIWPCHKIGQGQPSVIIWTNLVVLKYPMLHINFQGHHPFGSREEEFLRFLPYMGMAATLVKFCLFCLCWGLTSQSTIFQSCRDGSWSSDMDHLNKLSLPHPKEAPHEIWLQSAQWFQRRRCSKMLTNIHTHGRQRPTYTIISPWA